MPLDTCLLMGDPSSPTDIPNQVETINDLSQDIQKEPSIVIFREDCFATLPREFDVVMMSNCPKTMA